MIFNIIIGLITLHSLLRYIIPHGQNEYIRRLPEFKKELRIRGFVLVFFFTLLMYRLFA